MARKLHSAGAGDKLVLSCVFEAVLSAALRGHVAMEVGLKPRVQIERDESAHIT